MSTGSGGVGKAQDQRHAMSAASQVDNTVDTMYGHVVSEFKGGKLSISKVSLSKTYTADTHTYFVFFSVEKKSIKERIINVLTTIKNKLSSGATTFKEKISQFKMPSFRKKLSEVDHSAEPISPGKFARAKQGIKNFFTEYLPSAFKKITQRNDAIAKELENNDNLYANIENIRKAKRQAKKDKVEDSIYEDVDLNKSEISDQDFDIQNEDPDDIYEFIDIDKAREYAKNYDFENKDDDNIYTELTPDKSLEKPSTTKTYDKLVTTTDDNPIYDKDIHSGEEPAVDYDDDYDDYNYNWDHEFQNDYGNPIYDEPADLNEIKQSSATNEMRALAELENNDAEKTLSRFARLKRKIAKILPNVSDDKKTIIKKCLFLGALIAVGLAGIGILCFMSVSTFGVLPTVILAASTAVALTGTTVAAFKYRDKLKGIDDSFNDSISNLKDTLTSLPGKVIKLFKKSDKNTQLDVADKNEITVTDKDSKKKLTRLEKVKLEMKKIGSMFAGLLKMGAKIALVLVSLALGFAFMGSIGAVVVLSIVVMRLIVKLMIATARYQQAKLEKAESPPENNLSLNDNNQYDAV